MNVVIKEWDIPNSKNNSWNLQMLEEKSDDKTYNCEKRNCLNMKLLQIKLLEYAIVKQETV